MNSKYAYSHLQHLAHSRAMGRHNIHLELNQEATGTKTAAEKVLERIEAIAPNVEKAVADLKTLTTRTDAQEAQLKELSELSATVSTLKEAIKVRPGDLAGLESEKKKFNFGNMFLLAKGRMSETEAGFELEVLTQFSKKINAHWGNTNKDVINSLSGADGGVALPIEVSNQIIEAARATGELFNLGVFNPSLEGLASMKVPLEEPAADSEDGIIMQAAPTGEGQAYPTRMPKWKAHSFSPKKLGFIVGVTSDFLNMGGGFLNDYVMRVAPRDLNNKLEKVVLNGEGVEGEVPLGFLNYTNFTQTTLDVALGNNGRPLRFADIIAMEQALMEANRVVPGSKIGFYTRTTMLRGLRNQFARLYSGATVNDSLPITPLQFMNAEGLSKYIGYPLKWSTLVPKTTLGMSTDASTVIAGDWSYAWVPFWGRLQMQISNVATVGSVSAFAQDMTFMKFSQMYDAGIVAPDAFTKVSGFTPTERSA